MNFGSLNDIRIHSFQVFKLGLVASWLLLFHTCSWNEFESISYIEIELNNVDLNELNQTYISATLSANLSGLNDGDNISDYGFIWTDSNEDPTISSNSGLLSFGPTGENNQFSGEISDLTPNTDYKYRAYAVLGEIAYYSPVYEFRTPNPGFDVEALPVDGYTLTAAGPKIDVLVKVSGLPSGLEVKDGGILWRQGVLPTDQNNNIVFVGRILTDPGETNFTTTMNGLIPGETYFIIPFIDVGEARIKGDPITFFMGDIWTRVADKPSSEINAGIGFSIGSTGYLLGGGAARGGSDEQYAYHPESNTWTLVGTFPHAAANDHNVEVVNGLGYYFNGVKSMVDPGSFWRFDPNADPLWTELSPLPDDYPLRRQAWSFALGGKIYTGHGVAHDDGVFLTNARRDMWVYDPQNDTWSSLGIVDCTEDPNVPCIRVGASTFVIGDTAYLGPGRDGDGVFHHELWAFSDGVWTKKATPPEKFYFEYGAFAINGKGYLTLGDPFATSLPQTTELWEYDPIADSWTQRTSFPGDKRAGTSEFVINNRAYIGTGFSIKHLNDFWEYIPKEKE